MTVVLLFALTCNAALSKLKIKILHSVLLADLSHEQIKFGEKIDVLTKITSFYRKRIDCLIGSHKAREDANGLVVVIRMAIHCSKFFKRFNNESNSRYYRRMKKRASACSMYFSSQNEFSQCGRRSSDS